MLRTLLKKFCTPKILLLFLIIVGGFFRLYNLNWDQSNFLHPDERYIGSTVWWLVFGKELNPHFFAYGSFPLYVNLLVISLIKIFRNLTEWEVWAGAMLLGRLISGILSILLIPLTYKITQKLTPQRKSNFVPLLTAFFVTTSVGLIQYAHFATYEIILSFEYLLVFLVSLQLISEKKYNLKIIIYTFLLGIIFGLSLSTKVTSLIVLPVPFLALLFSPSSNFTSLKKIIVEKLSQFGFFIVVFALTAFMTEPFALLDFPTFLHAMTYESAVASGKSVFFTTEFIYSIPVWFQLTKIFPWIINPVLTLLLVPSLIWLILKVLKEKNRSLFLLLVIISALFLSQSFLFVKWIRYMVPLLPFLYITLSLFLADIESRVPKNLFKVCVSVVAILSICWSLAFFSIYTKTDTRIATAKWMLKNVEPQAKILVEDMDPGLFIIKSAFPKLTAFNFYELDGDNSQTQVEQLNNELKNNNYLVILSRGVYAGRLANPNLFPNASSFYQKLFSGKLGFTKIYESPNPFTFFGININDDSSEATFQVFDHPKLMVFKKITK